MSNEEPQVSSEQTHTIQASTFAELFEGLDAIGEIVGNQNSYTATELQEKILKVISGNAEIESLPRVHGIRETVGRLIMEKVNTLPAESTEVPAPETPQDVYQPTQERQGEDTGNEFANLETWDEVHQTIDAIGEIAGSHQTFTGEVLHDLVKQIQDGTATFNQLPRAHGLRATVQRIFSREYIASSKE